MFGYESTNAPSPQFTTFHISINSFGGQVGNAAVHKNTIPWLDLALRAYEHSMTPIHVLSVVDHSRWFPPKSLCACAIIGPLAG